MRKIRMGMVGGGTGAFIGAVHRAAALLDGHIELVCGAFSSTEEKSKHSGRQLYLPEERCYATYSEMMTQEAARPSSQRMDFVTIVTPNHLHFPVAKLALELGFDVMSDKPATLHLTEALELKEIICQTGRHYGLTHPYVAYPMVRQARDMIQSGLLGDIRKVVVEYPQGWLSEQIESSGQKQAHWRTDPEMSGLSCTMGDIGSHGENLLEFVSGLQIDSVLADLSSVVSGRSLDDDGNVLLRMSNGSKGVLYASQICTGEENGLLLRIWGEKGGLEWHQMTPGELQIKWPDKPIEVYRAGMPYLSASAQHGTRLPAGHPEGLIEAFANLYSNFARLIQSRLEKKEPADLDRDLPGIREAIRGMEFIEKVVLSSQQGNVWMPLEHERIE